MPHETRRFYEMTAKGNKSGEIQIYEAIGKDIWGDGSAVEAKKFIKDLKALGDIEDLAIRINSPGGSVYEGNAIYNALKNHKARKTVYVDSIAASMASVIAMVGDKVVMPKNAFLMIHNPASCACGEAKDFRGLADRLDKIKEGILTAYEDKTGQDRAKLSEMMDEETWMTADEAKELGFADEVSDAVEMAAHFDLSNFKKVPEFLALLEPDDDEPAPVTEPENKDTPANNDGATPMDFETLKKEQPEVAAKLMAEAAEAERKRISDIDAQAKLCPGHDDLVAELKADGKTTGPEAAAKLLAADAANRQTATNAIENNAVKPATQPAVDAQNANAAEVTVTDDEDTPVASDNSDEDKFNKQLKAKWDKSEDLRNEFRGKFSRFAAFSKAEANGQVKILGK